MGDAPLHHRTAADLAGMVRRREVSARELLDTYLGRIAAGDGPVNAVVTLDPERARADAAAADEELVAGRARGPLHGLPITVKDALAVAGLRSTGGARELADHVPAADADVVARVRAAGAIPFAKTNVPRWSGDIQTYNDLFGTTTNPWDTRLVPGGSSGGPAAAVALGFTAFELGTDIGGSIRIPSAYCGVVGHKPSFGLVPCGGYLDRVDYGRTEPDVNVHGPIARSVDDLELLLDLLAGPRPDAALAVRHAVPPARHDRIDRFRVAVWADAPECPASADTVAAVTAAGQVLSGLGATVRLDARPDLDPLQAFWHGLWLISAAVSPSFDDETAAFLASLRDAEGLPPSAVAGLGGLTASYREWQAVDVERAKLRERWAAFFGEVDALLCPVIVRPPFPHLQEGSEVERVVEVDGSPRPYFDLMFWTMLIGMAYLPATVVPVGWTADGLPLAVQVVGPFMEDRTPLAVARALRDALGPLRLPEQAVVAVG